MSQVAPATPDVEFDEPVRLPKKKNDDDEMDITPMIDITFLLLIFFLVASKINSEAAVTLPPAKHGLAVPTKECVTVVVRRGPGETAEVFHADGNKQFSKDPDQQDVEIAEYITKGLEEGKSEVMIKAEGDVKFREIDRVKKAVSESMDDGQNINIAILQQN